MSLADQDKPLFAAIQREAKRQEEGLELIASENYTSAAVREATGSVLTNKYAEGYPGKRYYGGCVYVDEAEELACDRAKQLFNCGFANVQPHSGAQANMAVYMGLLDPGETVMGQSLAHGGHLTHGSPVNFSGKLYNIISYELDEETQALSYDTIGKLAQIHRPKMIIAGYSAYSRVIDWERFREIADSVGAYLMVDMAHIAGLVAGGAHPSPVPYAHVVTTTTHKTLRGPRGGLILTNDEALAKKIDKAIFPGVQGGPLMHVVAAKAVAFAEALKPEFSEYAKQVVTNAQALADQLTTEGFTLISGGTDNHLMLVDLRSFNVTGKVAEEELDKVGITLNKNAIPNDPESPFVTSGIRIGTPAVTTRGLKEPDMKTVGQLIAKTLRNSGDEKTYAAVRKEVKKLTKAHPLPN